MNQDDKAPRQDDLLFALQYSVDDAVGDAVLVQLAVENARAGTGEHARVDEPRADGRHWNVLLEDLQLNSERLVEAILREL